MNCFCIWPINKEGSGGGAPRVSGMSSAAAGRMWRVWSGGGHAEPWRDRASDVEMIRRDG